MNPKVISVFFVTPPPLSLISGHVRVGCPLYDESSALLEGVIVGRLRGSSNVGRRA